MSTDRSIILVSLFATYVWDTMLATAQELRSTSFPLRLVVSTPHSVRPRGKWRN
jgi:hypothetical protein